MTQKRSREVVLWAARERRKDCITGTGAVIFVDRPVCSNGMWVTEGGDEGLSIGTTLGLRLGQCKELRFVVEDV